MNKKAISILLTAAMGVSVLAAGTVTVSAAEKKDKYVIGMSQCNLGEPWRVAMNDQIAMAAEKHPEFEVILQMLLRITPNRLQILKTLYRWV